MFDKLFMEGLKTKIMLLTATQPAKSPLDHLKGNGNDAFGGVEKVALETLASANSVITTVGICLLGVVAIVAAVCFGLFKDSSAIKEHKKWIIRIIGAAIGVGCALTIVGIALGIGEKFNI